MTNTRDELHDATSLWTATDPGALHTGIIGDSYEYDLSLTPRQEAEALSEAAAGAGIYLSDDALEALVSLVENEREVFIVERAISEANQC